MVKSWEKREENITLAIDRDKESQNALKWAVDNLLTRGQTLTLLHIKVKQPPSLPYSGSNPTKPGDDSTELFLPFRCYCARKDINCQDVTIENFSAAKGIIDYVQHNAVETLVLGASKMTLLRRFKATDVSNTVMKKAPSFCTVYAITRGKISSMRSATSSPPNSTMRHAQPSNLNVERRQHTMQRTQDEIAFKSPFSRRGHEGTYTPSVTDSDISFVSSGRQSVDRMFPSFYDMDVPRLSVSSEYEANRCSFEQSIDLGSSYTAFSSSSLESGRTSCSLQSQDEIEAEMRKLKMELKHTMEMYNSACKEAISAKKMAAELRKWKAEKEHKLEEVRHSKEAAMAMAENEKEKSRVAMEAAMAAQRIAELESQKRKHIETAEEKKRAVNSLAQTFSRYRHYRIEEIEEATEDFAPSRKIGEGGYGPVYKGILDYTPVAIKVLRPDAAQGRSQFQREVEVLTCMRHPNMVLLLGACPEYGCLVYEHMSNGSLEDLLFGRGNSPILSWRLRFRIAAEIATGLHFLHQMKPEPLVHRDLKPGNILLDQHFNSKISDVGLARLVPPSVADTVTQYRMTATAGTFCYIDPEYQQTGMLGTKSDIYSFGIMLLQILTAKPPMGLTHHVQKAIEKGTFAEILDSAVPDWPVEEALVAAKIGLQCAELRRKDRPDLGNVVLPELNRLRALAEESLNFGASPNRSSNNSHIQTPVSTTSEVMSDPQLKYGSNSSSNQNSSAS